jgi:cytochrome P450
MIMTAEPMHAIERLPIDFMQNPYEILERLRNEGPAHPLVFPHGAKVWLITRYDDVRQLLSDPRVHKDGRRMNEMFARHSGVTVEDDEPASGSTTNCPGTCSTATRPGTRGCVRW